MHVNKTPPYPRLAEILRESGKIFETTPSNRYLDEMISAGCCDFEQFRKNQKDIFSSWKCGDHAKSKLLDQHIRDFGDLLIRDYIAFIREPSVAGFDRRQTVPMLLEVFLAPRLIEFLQPVMRELAGVELAHLLAHDHPVGFAFEWLAHKYPKDWNEYEASRRKDYIGHDDNLSGWRNGDYVPTFDYLLSPLLDDFAKKACLNAEEALKIRELFYVTRSLAALFRDTESHGFHSMMRSRLFDSNRVVDPVQRLKDHYAGNLHSVFKQVQPLYALNDEISKRLFKVDARGDRADTEIDELLVQAESLCHQLKSLNAMWWRTSRLRAVWFLCSGRVDEARKEYKRLFDYIFYVGMEDLDRVYHEALVVAAVCKDRVFLRQLKNLGLLFGRFSLPITPENSKASKAHKSPEVEDWEVLVWANSFQEYFPEPLFFDGVQPVKSGTALKGGEIVFQPDDYNLQLKDWRDPIKQLKNIGGKRVTALIYFTTMGKVEEVEALIKMGADADKLSSSNDSALLIALQRTHPPVCGPPDLRLFESVSSAQHSPDTLNTPTDKKKMTVLGCAVDTRIPYVVDKVLSMGVNPDMRCDVDQITPLYKAINSQASWSSFEGIERMLKNPTPELLDSFRRHAPRLAGMDHVTAMQNISRLFENPRHMQIGGELLDFLPPQIDSYSLIAIIESLLDKGADPNQLHNLNGWVGFTPLMLAAELNLPEVVKLLRAKGASSSLKALAPDGRKVDALEVALAHGSHEALVAFREYGER